MRRVLLCLALIVTACGDDTAEPPTTTAGSTTTSASISTTAATTIPPASTTTLPFDGGGTERPPHEFETLAALFDPVVAPLGYRLGRAALIDRATYEETPEGNHLALYLEPLDARTPDQYAEEFLPIVSLFVPAVFSAWPGLDSFDVCQEPFDWEGATSPPGLTVFDIDRDAAALIDWATIDLTGLLEADATLAGMTIHAIEAIQASAVWTAAREG